MTTRFVAITADPSESRWLDVPVPEAIYVVPFDMAGEDLLHLPRVLPFDKGHDWSVRDGRVRISLAAHHLVLRYGPEPKCCGRPLAIGSRYCPWCGTATSSIVEAAP